MNKIMEKKLNERSRFSKFFQLKDILRPRMSFKCSDDPYFDNPYNLYERKAVFTPTNILTKLIIITILWTT